MHEHPADDRAEVQRDGASWIPAGGSEALRAVVRRYLSGDRRVGADVERLATELARAARRATETPERLLIGIRSLWRELGLSQGDRLQLAAIYEQLVRQAIERYYDEDR